MIQSRMFFGAGLLTLFVALAVPPNVWSQSGGRGCNYLVPNPASLTPCAEVFDSCDGNDCGYIDWCLLGEKRVKLLLTSGISKDCVQVTPPPTGNIHCGFSLVECTQSTLCYMTLQLEQCKWGDACASVVRVSRAVPVPDCDPTKAPEPPAVIDDLGGDHF
jgi:hypothetical protein